MLATIWEKYREHRNSTTFVKKTNKKYIECEHLHQHRLWFLQGEQFIFRQTFLLALYFNLMIQLCLLCPFLKHTASSCHIKVTSLVTYAFFYVYLLFSVKPVLVSINLSTISWIISYCEENQKGQILNINYEGETKRIT